MPGLFEYREGLNKTYRLLQNIEQEGYVPPGSYTPNECLPKKRC